MARHFLAKCLVLSLLALITSQFHVAASPNSKTFIVVVRHAEKTKPPTNQTLSVAADQALPLTKAGHERAKLLVDFVQFLSSLSGKSVSDIFFTDFKRTKETVEPVITRFKSSKPLIQEISKDKSVNSTVLLVKGLIDDDIKQSKPGRIIVIVGHSETVPTIVSRLSGLPDSSVPPILKEQFDNLYLISVSSTGKTLRPLRYGERSK